MIEKILQGGDFVAVDTYNNRIQHEMHISDTALRDYFAGLAMQAMVNSESINGASGQKNIAIQSYNMADAMLKARNGKL